LTGHVRTERVGHLPIGDDWGDERDEAVGVEYGPMHPERDRARQDRDRGQDDEEADEIAPDAPALDARGSAHFDALGQVLRAFGHL
jgi:hypothetical protein